MNSEVGWYFYVWKGVSLVSSSSSSAPRSLPREKRVCVFRPRRSLIGTLVTHCIGRKLIAIGFAKQRSEADFRFALVEVRDHAEAVRAASSVLGGPGVSAKGSELTGALDSGSWT